MHDATAFWDCLYANTQKGKRNYKAASNGEELMPTLSQHDYSANILLSKLRAEEYASISAHSDRVTLELGEVLEANSHDCGSAYFPTTSVISLVCDMEDGATVEVALAGREGLVGTNLYLGGNPVANRATVGIAGEAVRMDGRALRDLFMRNESFRRVLLRYTGTLLAQITLTAACNRKHTLEKRLCRWLLLLHDRVSSNQLVMTQEFIAAMLGSRRETVTVAAGRLQDAGLIQYSRGTLRILDRNGLEEACCGCYQAVRTESLLSPSVRAASINVSASPGVRVA
jgi:CRP-like cAMP-binding protein